MGAVTTSIVVQINDPAASGSSSARAQAEVDSREDGLNNGKTSFIAGDSVYILLFKDSNVSITSVTASSGTCVKEGSGSMTIDEFVTLANSDSTSTEKPAVNLTATVVAGAATLVSTENGNIVASEPSVAVISVSYTANFDIYKLSGFPAALDGKKDYPIVVFFSGVSL